MAEEERLADLLRTAVGELVTDPGQAALRLAEVAQALDGEPELQDIRARALSLLAQARLATLDVSGAEKAVQSALRILREQGDAEGLGAVRSLQEQIAAERQRIRRDLQARSAAAGLASQSLESLEEAAGSPLALADILIKHAGALRLHERPTEALRSARRAIQAADEAGAVREQVLGRLTLVELDRGSARAALEEAHRIADEASETTLIGLVAKAAGLAGVELALLYGPETASPGSRETP